MKYDTLINAGTALIFGLMIGGTSPARANVLNPADWSTSGPGSQTVSAIPDGVDLSYSFSNNFCAGCTTPSWAFTTIAPVSGTLGFDWEQTAQYGFFDVSGSLTLIDVTTGATDTLNTAPGTFFSGPITGTGAVNVTGGDTIEILANADNFDSQPFVNGDVQLTAFAGVSEPTSLALLGAALVALGLLRHRATG